MYYRRLRQSRHLADLVAVWLVAVLCASRVSASPREWQPLVLNGGQLRALAGAHLSHLEVLAIHGGRAEPIPFQVDAVSHEGRYTLTDGPQGTPDNSRRSLSPDDEIAMMLSDLGEKSAAPSELPPRALEIEVADPLDGSHRYAYVGVADTPRLSARRYVAFDPRIHQVRPHSGQLTTAGNLRRMLEGSQIRESHRDCARVQDPYSFRCQPQVMGACLDLMRNCAATLTIESNAVTDNPLLFVEQSEVLSGGNFHAEPMAFAADMLALAIAEIGSLSERRMAVLVDPKMSGLPPFLVENSGLNSGFMIAQVTAAALVSENKALAAPCSVDSIPTSANQEDHVSMSLNAARHARAIVRNVEQILALELLCSIQAIALQLAKPGNRDLRTGRGTGAAYQMLRDAGIAVLIQDRVLYPDIRRAVQLVRDGALVRAAREVGPC